MQKFTYFPSREIHFGAGRLRKESGAVHIEYALGLLLVVISLLAISGGLLVSGAIRISGTVNVAKNVAPCSDRIVSLSGMTGAVGTPNPDGTLTPAERAVCY